jgi:hypothetical protein
MILALRLVVVVEQLQPICENAHLEDIERFDVAFWRDISIMHSKRKTDLIEPIVQQASFDRANRRASITASLVFPSLIN